MRGPVKWVFHRPRWEIFAMVSIQIWVTRFHIRCTGELEQVCLAAAAGSLFFSTGLESDVKYAGYDKRRFCPERFCGEMTPPAANVIQVSTTVPRGCRARRDPGQNRHREEASGEQLTPWASRALAARWWKQLLLELVCFGFGGCNQRRFPEERHSIRPAGVAVTVRRWQWTATFHSWVMKPDMSSGSRAGASTFHFQMHRVGFYY